jgi:hypothetical protein
MWWKQLRQSLREEFGDVSEEQLNKKEDPAEKEESRHKKMKKTPIQE